MPPQPPWQQVTEFAMACGLAAYVVHETRSPAALALVVSMYGLVRIGRFTWPRITIRDDD